MICYGSKLALACSFRRILLYPKGRGTVDDLSVSFGVEGGSELSLGWSRYAQLSMTMVNQLQGSKSITKGTLFASPDVYFTFMLAVFSCWLAIPSFSSKFNLLSRLALFLFHSTQLLLQIATE